MTVRSAVGVLSRPALELSRRGNAMLEAAVFRQPPRSRWITDNEVIHERPHFRVRRFAAPRSVEPASSRPVVVVPPEVNTSWVVDFGPGQSLVAALGEAGFCQVGALEWRPPTSETAGRDIDDSIMAIAEAIEVMGGRAHLIGVCQGGWEATILAALRPELVESLTLVAAPIDFDAGQGVVKQVARTMPMAAYRSLVAAGGGVMRGELISAGFDNLMVFERFVLKYMMLWNHLGDEAWMERFHQLNDWYRSPKSLPGPLYLRAVRELFKENRLIQGRMICLGRRVDMKQITAPLCLVAGHRDHITPAEQVMAARAAVSSTEVLEVMTDGGHIGTFMGRSELQRHWPPLLRWLRQRERPAEPQA